MRERVGRRMMAVVALVALLWMVNAPVGAQVVVPAWQAAAGGTMEFEVASVRLSKPGTFTPPSFAMSADDSFNQTGGIFHADFPLSVYVSFAYKLDADQGKLMEASLPKWATTDAYTVQARSDKKSPTKDQMRLMVQAVLAERFKLKVHREGREMAVLGLSLVKPGKTGPGLRPHAEGPPCDVHVALKAVEKGPRTPGEEDGGMLFPCDMYGAAPGPNGTVIMGSRNTTMELLAPMVNNTGRLGRPVVDRTGLTGRYDFTIQWTSEFGKPDDGTPPEAGGTTFLEALKEQLGLKLVPGKAVLEVLVVDGVERPTEN